MWLSVPASAGSAKLQTRQCAVSRQQYLTLQSPCKKCLLKTTRIPTALGTCQCRAADTINGSSKDARAQLIVSSKDARREQRIPATATVTVSV